MVNDRYYSGLKEIRIVTTTDEVNKLLASGWEYIKSHDINDANQVNTRVHWEMGKFGEVKASSPPSTPASSPPKSGLDLTQDILRLPWEDSEYQGVDKWVPADKIGGAIVDYFQKKGVKTDKGSYKLAVGEFDMYLTTKALTRYKKK